MTKNLLINKGNKKFLECQEEITIKDKLMNLEFIWKGLGGEIRPIHKPKNTKFQKEPGF